MNEYPLSPSAHQFLGKELKPHFDMFHISQKNRTLFLVSSMKLFEYKAKHLNSHMNAALFKAFFFHGKKMNI